MGSKNSTSEVLAPELKHKHPLIADSSELRESARKALAAFYQQQSDKTYGIVRADRLRAFLVALANEMDTARIARKYPEFLWPDLPSDVTRWLDAMRQHNQQEMQEQEQNPKYVLGVPIVQTVAMSDKPSAGAYLLRLREGLRRVWTSGNERERSWLTFRLVALNHRTLAFLDPEIGWLGVADPITATEVPPFTPFEQALVYLQRNHVRAKVCRNEKCAIEPFFFSDRNSFCSEVCSEVSRKAAKRRAWHKNKKKWRSAAV